MGVKMLRLLFPGTFIYSDCSKTASGYRNAGDGTLYNAGTNGYGWLSSPGGQGSRNGSNLNFNSSTLNVANENNRANGFPVRCVPELTNWINRCIYPNTGEDGSSYAFLCTLILLSGVGRRRCESSSCRIFVCLLSPLQAWRGDFFTLIHNMNTIYHKPI